MSPFAFAKHQIQARDVH